MVPGLPDLADGLYELPYWQLPLLVLHRPWLRPDLDRFVCQLMTHHMEEADCQILDPRESRRVASCLPPAGKPALTRLILLCGPITHMLIQDILNPLPAPRRDTQLNRSMQACQGAMSSTKLP